MKILHDEKIFFVRIFLKVQEQVVSFPTRRTRASGSVWAQNGMEKKAVPPLSDQLSNHHLHNYVGLEIDIFEVIFVMR